MKYLAISVFKKRSRVMPILVPLALVAVTTSVLMVVDVFVDTERLVFAYLVPTTFAAIAYGSMVGTFTAIVSALCAAYFIYPPTFALWVENPLHLVELVVFAALAFAASHIVGHFSRWRDDA